MASIGPDIPPGLLNQRRSLSSLSNSEDEAELEGPAPPPPAFDTGPQIPSHLSSKSRPYRSPSPIVGPSVPSAKAQAPEPEQADEDEEEEDDYKPALPPDLAAVRGAPSMSSKRVIGPAFPPPSGAGLYEDDEEEEEVGPLPLPLGVQLDEGDGVREFIEREERRRKMAEDALKPKAPKREEWMLVPPSAEGLLGLLDPAKLRQPRQFSRSTQVKSNDTTLWTETPAERQQRLQDEIMGKRKRIENADPDAGPEGSVRKRRKEREVRKDIEEYTRKHRGETLLNAHQSAENAKKKTEPEEPPVIWDHDRDMSLGGVIMDEKKRNQLINDSRSLGDRFGSGRSGGFL